MSLRNCMAVVAVVFASSVAHAQMATGRRQYEPGKMADTSTKPDAKGGKDKNKSKAKGQQDDGKRPTQTGLPALNEN